MISCLCYSNIVKIRLHLLETCQKCTALYDYQHTHKFLWRKFDTTRPPDHYALTSVPFGNRPSGAIAIIALRKTAELLEDDYAKVVDVVKTVAILMISLHQKQVLKMHVDLHKILIMYSGMVDLLSNIGSSQEIMTKTQMELNC